MSFIVMALTAQGTLVAFLSVVAVLLVLPTQVLIVASATSLFLKHDNKLPIHMTDILYLIASIGFFALMLVFIWACEKV
jgi:hypothetical protein